MIVNERVAYQAAIEHVQQSLGAQGSNAHWLNYLYHHTDLSNMISLLSKNSLYSRLEAVEMGLLSHDAANQGVIDRTDERVRRCARLYFGPRTPTLYNVEGFRPVVDASANLPACPMPFVLCFRAADVLAEPNVVYSSENAATADEWYSEPEAYLSLPWEDILHRGSLANNDRKRQIVARRHAEVLVPSPMPLSRHLVGIYCRSQAEFETLQTSIRRAGLVDWADDPRIRVTKTADSFYFQWVFVAQVTWTGKDLIIGFDPPAQNQNRGPFKLEVQFSGQRGQPFAVHQDENFIVPSGSNSLSFRFAMRSPRPLLRVQIKLDDCIAFDHSVRRVDG